jgi:hypothetical protein
LTEDLPTSARLNNINGPNNQVSNENLAKAHNVTGRNLQEDQHMDDADRTIEAVTSSHQLTQFSRMTKPQPNEKPDPVQ